MQLPKTKAEARDLGLPRFFTGKPCKRNHVAERRSACGTCIDCARIAEEKYRNNNIEGCRKSQTRWRENNREIAGERVKQCRIANPEPSRRAAKKFYDANPDKCRKSSNDWRTKNKKRALKTTAEWRKNNRARCRALTMLRHAAKRHATPPWLTQEQLDEMALIYECAELCTQLTGVEHEVDHEEPLQGKDRCGLHIPKNLQVMPASENRSKGNRTK